MKFDFDLTEDEQRWMKVCGYSELDICVHRGVFKPDHLSEEDMDFVKRELNAIANRLHDSGGKGLTYYQDDYPYFLFVNSQQFRDVVTTEAEAHGMVDVVTEKELDFTEWFPEFMDYVYFANKRMFREHLYWDNPEEVPEDTKIFSFHWNK